MSTLLSHDRFRPSDSDNLFLKIQQVESPFPLPFQFPIFHFPCLPPNRFSTSSANFLLSNAIQSLVFGPHSCVCECVCVCANSRRGVCGKYLQCQTACDVEYVECSQPLLQREKNILNYWNNLCFLKVFLKFIVYH